jgi:hypothetical protein
MRTLFATTLWLSLGSSAWAIDIPTVPVRNSSNAPDTTGFGAVPYNYRIGTLEVTNTQYAEFLSAKAASDPFGLYDTRMDIDGIGGITQGGSSPNYSYSLKPGMENKPVVFVDWYDCLRFANWLHNGQGNGDTETGAYSVNGFIPSGPGPPFPPLIPRNPNARWFLPSWNEWYKAAYYNPQTESYFEYPTASDTAPTAEAPPGGSNSANYESVVGALTDAGAYAESYSPHGTFDQGGNVAEWSDWNPTFLGVCLLGGSYIQLLGGEADDLSAAGFRNVFLTSDLLPGSAQYTGFRIAAVPEPPTLAMALIAFAALAAFVRRHRQR